MRVLGAAAVAGACLISVTGAGGPVSAAVPASSAVTQAQDARQGSAAAWGRAQRIPGLAALVKGGNPQIAAVSCASSGNCTAGGLYYVLTINYVNETHAYVASEVNGVWGRARLVPGLAALDKGPNSGVVTVSCASPGNCTAAGDYRPVPDRLVGPGFAEPFVVSQVHGTWHRARQVPGVTALNTGRVGGITALSCTGPGDCSAGGIYTVKARPFRKQEIFVVSEVHGTWLRARPAPGTAALNTGGFASIDSLSCANPGNCAAGGFYKDRWGYLHGFLMTEARGRWSAAQPVRGLAPMTIPGEPGASVNSVSCAAPGNCAAGGSAPDQVGTGQAFVVNEVNGRWQKARPVAGIAGLNKGKAATVDSVSCRSPGDCSAVGSYARRQQQGTYFSAPFIVSEVHGRWGSGRLVPGMTALNTGGDAGFTVVSCASAGNCAAGGYYYDRLHQQPFVVSQVRGTWGKARRVPGIGALGGGAAVGGAVQDLSCPKAGRCGAAGYFVVYRGNVSTAGVFVVSQT